MNAFLTSVSVIALFLVGIALKASYEKYCIRTRRKFRSWLGD